MGFERALNQKVAEAEGNHLKTLVGDINPNRLSKLKRTMWGEVYETVVFLDGEPLVTYKKPVFKSDNNRLTFELTYILHQ